MQKTFILLWETGYRSIEIKLVTVCGNSWVFSEYTIKELAVLCVPLCTHHRQTEVFAQTESNEITSMTHGTFIEGSFHTLRINAF